MPTLVTNPPLPPGVSPVLVAGGPGWNAGGVGTIGQAGKLVNVPPFEELDGYREQFRNDGTQEVVRVFKTPWGTRKLFVDYMLGFSDTAPAVMVAGQQVSGPGITRTIPDQVPEVGYQHLYASDCRMVGGKGAWGLNPNVFLTDHGVPAGQPYQLSTQPLQAAPGAPGGPVLPQVPVPMIAYYDGGTGKDGLAIYEVIYTARPYEIRTDGEMLALQKGELERYVEFAIQPAMQTLTIPQTGNAGVYFQTGPFAGTQVPANFGFIYLPTEELSYTWYEVPDYPRTAIKNCVGKVNAASFDGAQGRDSYDAGTLLCQPPFSVLRYRHTTGRIYWRIGYRLLHRPSGWNFLPDATGTFQKVAYQSAPGGPVTGPLYQSVDFGQLFQAPAPVTYQ